MSNISIRDYLTVKQALYFLKEIKDENNFSHNDKLVLHETVNKLQILINKLEKE